MGTQNAVLARLSKMTRPGVGFLCALSVFVVLAADRRAAAAEKATPTGLLRSCQAIIANGRGDNKGAMDIPRAGLACWYYMSAVQNMSVLVDQNGQSLLGICAPANTTLLDYVRIFVRYGQKMPDRVEENPAAVAVEALNAAFACGRKSNAGATKTRAAASPSLANKFAPRKATLLAAIGK